MLDPARLREQPLLMDLDEHDRAQVARWIEEIRAEPGELLIEQGSMAYELFLIESGTVDVLRDGELLATLGAGDVVGEIALLAQQRRIASVRASSPVVALALPAEAFQQIASEMPEFADELRQVMASRRSAGPTQA
jgi:CRP/FNR family cyclic AMP-dependent transcriptional regulator